ncbi:MAG: hypothetical protein KJ970_13480 [Candidatus Eisenbacteria bacterium]|uniref:PEP-CTERM sorting domain-containing protein n=1 Tax=Eiseniibacteriota bacterium TaxID=2212470 RepID=A0A948RWS8_UNCEI|nr:hypothetical protein [Candidatus Eisenbacteria bacterium]MBU1949535.1 hypothetical protein [Candidatus Eisenbacteria bacterium]MBU2691926.1 hypothetical protein [Candidatus Eisenbacteria bacterium]
MMRRFCQYLLLGLPLVFLSLAAPRSALAAIVFDDHFTGDSGGMPAGWSRIAGMGAVVEAGTTVTLGGGPIPGEVAISSDATIDPGSGTVTIETEFVGIAGQGASGLFVGPGFPDGALFFCAIQWEGGRIEVNAADVEGGLQWYDVGYLVGYTGGPIRLTVVLGPASFSVSTDSPPFSSGPIDYTTAFATFTREDLGAAAAVMLFDYGEGPSIFDRVLVETVGATPVEGMTFGRIKDLYRP